MRNLSIVLVLSFMLAPNLAYGQGTGTGTIIGTVMDQSGAVVVGAEVRLTDRSTGLYQVQPTSQVGTFTFSDVKPGNYDIEVTMKGFRKLVVTSQEVIVGQSLMLTLTLEVGAATQTVEVTAAPGAELQTLNSTIGSAITGNTILQLPTFSRDTTSLLYLQPTAVPDFNGATGDVTSGTVAGQMSDQNTYSIDGGNATDTLSGNNSYIDGFVAGTAAVPTPVESIEEFKVTTSNATADFSNSSGGHVQLVTKRGTNSFHGSAYDYLQNSALDSNDWSNNFTAQPKPASKYNRFGFALGGPLLPARAGGKTYFYVNYEGFRWPESSVFERDVPSAKMRAGVLQFRDANGNVQSYNLNGTTGCGPTGTNACDPLGIGLNAAVSNMWSQYVPLPNDLNAGDRLNTFGFQAPVSIPQSQNFVVGRLDHDFGSKWRWFSSYRWYDSTSPNTDQVDIGGLLPGDTLGVPKAVSINTNSPRYFVTGLTATLTPTLTNDFHFSFLRDQWGWGRGGFIPQGSDLSAVIELGDELPPGSEPGPGTSLMPINVNTQQSRQRLWDGHNADFRENMSWLKGKHFFQFGGEFLHDWWHFNRYDDIVSGLANTVVDNLDWNSGQITIPASSQPIPCTATVGANCLPSTELPEWNELYTEALGLVAQSQTLVSRSGSNLNLNPIDTPLDSYMLVHTFNLFASDSWRIKPNLTFTLGLTWGYQTPPYAPNGAQDMLVDSSGNPLSVFTYLQNRLTAAEAGGTYAPIIGYSPVREVGGPGGTRYPYQPFYGAFQPRVALAWTPHASGGWLGTVLGNGATVFRGGYSRFYDRGEAISLLTDSVLGDGFLQPIDCSAPTVGGTCAGFGNTTPSTAFRIGTGTGGNGGAAPLPPIPQTLPIPVEPGINSGYISAESAGINNYLPPGYADEVNFTIQRQFKGNVLVEVGYVGNWDHNLYQGIDLNDVPWMMKLNGQTFAQAYDNLWMELTNGKPVTVQPFFEAALAGSAYCGSFASCSAAVAANEGPTGTGNLTAEYVTSLWSDLDPYFTFGTPKPQPQLLSTTQCFWCYYTTSAGFSNYNSLVATVQKRAGNGLTLSGSFTYGHALGTIGLSQTYTLDNLDDPWNPRVDYGPQYFDHKFLSTIIASYELPFGPGRRFLKSTNPVLKRVLGGWTFAPIFSFASGQPLDVYTGSFQEFGAGFDENGAAAVPLVNTAGLSNSAHQGINPTGVIGANSAAVNGGPGVNMFKNPVQVYNDFAPCLVGICNRAGGGGQLRAPSLWNLDFSINKTTNLTERVKLEFFSEWFNGLNHMAWGGDLMSYNLEYPQGFGTLSQFNPLQSNYTRIIQLGMRLSF
jgi:hypothetical protein